MLLEILFEILALFEALGLWEAEILFEILFDIEADSDELGL